MKAALQPVAEAQARIAQACRALATETIALSAAYGRVLAADVLARRPLPSFTNSAMDGFAIQSEAGAGVREMIGVIAAGAPADARLPTVTPLTAAQIFTGAPMPPGADAVVMIEHCTVADGRVTVPATRAQVNVRQCGEDIEVGAVAVAAGTRVTPGAIAMLAAQGATHIEVFRRPRVAIIATGDELVPAGTPLAPGQVVDCSAHMLCAQLLRAGAEPHYLGIVADDPQATTAALAAALTYDAVITTGGVSAGDRDYVHAALQALGITPQIAKVAMKPGKPFAFALASVSRPHAAATQAHHARAAEACAANHEAPRTVPLFLLPGNPVSTWVAFELFVRPALCTLQGLAEASAPRLAVRMPRNYVKEPGRAHYLRGTLRYQPNTDQAPAAHAATALPRGMDAIAWVELHPKQGSGMLSSLVATNVLVEIAAEATEVAAGDIVTGYYVG